MLDGSSRVHAAQLKRCVAASLSRGVARLAFTNAPTERCGNNIHGAGNSGAES
jgi:sulfur relay (sulfurtransferase) complex TusBCD TusD component (DsrE family)